jgi:drug/metabolite transporter (DMT)-like permease
MTREPLRVVDRLCPAQGRVVADQNLSGIGYRLASVAALSTMGALIKLAEMRGASLAELLFFRQSMAVPVVLLATHSGPGLASLKTRRFLAHVTRTMIGLASMVFMFGTLLILPLAEATTMQFTAPLFATVLGALALREPTGLHRWAAVVLGFIGILVVTQPGSGHIPLLGATTGLIAASLAATVSILLRRLGQTEPATTIVFYFSLLSVPVLLPFLIFYVKPHDAFTWATLVGVGLFGGLGQIAMTRSLTLAPVAVVVPMDYSGLIWATLFGYVLFGALPSVSTWLGAPIIIASGLYIVWREHRRARELTVSATAVD